jgi:hypothetical protein
MSDHVKVAYANHQQVKHLWAQDENLRAYSAQKRCSCRNGVLYSYSTAIALFMTLHGRRICFITRRRYSNTTDKHMPHPSDISGVKVVYVDQLPEEGIYSTNPNWEPNPNWLEYEKSKYIQTIVDEMPKFSKRRAGSDAHGFHLSSIRALKFKLEDFCATFNIPLTEDELPNFESGVDMVEFAKKETERKHQLELRRMEAVRQSAAKWLNGVPLESKEGDQHSWYEHYPTLLRLKPSDLETVQTSRKAEFPLQDAKVAWDYLKPIVRNEVHVAKEDAFEEDSWVPLHRPLHLGHYKITDITRRGDGFVKAGCHQIAFPELVRFATTLGLN